MMKKVILLTMSFFMLFTLTSMAQSAKRTTKSTKSAKSSVINDGAIHSFKGHIDFLKIGDKGGFDPVAKNVKANFVFKVFRDPSDRMKPGRKTVVLTCDIDFKALYGSDEKIPLDWSWSGRGVEVVTQEDANGTAYAIMDDDTPVAVVMPNYKSKGGRANFILLKGGGNQIAGLRQGMNIDDMARKVQSEIPGTRVVITGNKQDGLTEYVLLSYGESKVYEVTGDYHYELNTNEPYFTFWIDSNNKLVKWFKLKNY